MGLAERRAVSAFQESKYPALKQQIDDAAGFDVPIEVKWETLATGDYAASYDAFFPKIYFEPIANAFKAVCIDQMGKDSLKETLKKIVILNQGGFYSASSAIKFQGGVLTIDHLPDSSVDATLDRANTIRELLENAL